MSSKRPAIAIVRVYDVRDADEGYRILVDRLWPRGVKKENLRLDEWTKDLAPSTELRKWFDHRVEHWDEFQRRYTAELQTHLEEVDRILKIAAHQRVLLLFAARDVDHNHAIVLRDFLTARRTTSE